MIRFLGSVTFALLLIGVTALFVIAGTFIESVTGSHRFAAHFTYSSPHFAWLLVGFFINILVSALRRWPFKKRHIPFLITHTGLLMILSGALIKNHYGIQGVMRIAEGSGSSEILIPDTHALLVESKEGREYFSVPVQSLHLNQVATLPHSIEKRETWIKGEQLSIAGLPPIPVGTSVKAHLVPESEPWTIWALDLSEIILKDPYGRIHRQPLSSDSLVAYDRGYGGYAVQLKIPYISKSPNEIEKERLTLLKEQLAAAKLGELSPPLRLLFYACRETGVDFASCCVTFLDHWRQTEGWLYPSNRELPSEIEGTLACLDWSRAPDGDLQGALWIAALADRHDLMGKDFLNELPFLEASSVTHLAQQLMALADQLPKCPLKNVAPPRLFSAYLSAYDLHLNAIPYGEVKQEWLTLETPLAVHYEPAPPSKKWEENRPVISLKATLNGKTSLFSIGYDPTATGLKWPLLGGAFRVRYQPQAVKLPYQVRLRQARQICYPGSCQPYSFESDLLIREIATGVTKEVTISMNNVYETKEGYRLYLSHIAPPEEGALKQIQLAVNYDPAKYWLTYPGGIVLSLGICLLFFLKKRLK